MLACRGTYRYVLPWNSGTAVYRVVPVCTGTYQYVLICPILSRCTGFQMGNSVHLRIYCHVMSISNHMHLILCISFVMPSSYFLLFINALIRLLPWSTAHCVLEAKVTKRYVQIMNICNPLYILIHTRTYWYIKSGWSRLVMTYCRCCTLVQCIAHSILPFWDLVLVNGQASHAGLATPKLPQPLVDLIDIAALQSVRCSSIGTAIREAWILALADYPFPKPIENDVLSAKWTVHIWSRL